VHGLSECASKPAAADGGFGFGKFRPFPNRVENFIGLFNSMRPSAVGAA